MDDKFSGLNIDNILRNNINNMFGNPADNDFNNINNSNNTVGLNSPVTSNMTDFGSISSNGVYSSGAYHTTCSGNNSSNAVNNSSSNNTDYNNGDTISGCSCGCGNISDTESMPGSMCVGYGYVPWQMMNNVYQPEDSLEQGTLFPELNLSMNEYGTVCKSGGVCNEFRCK